MKFVLGVKGLVILTSLFVLLLTGVLVLSFVGFPLILDAEIAKATRLDLDTDQWDRFVELPFPVQFKVYIFHINNMDAVIEHGALPELVEKGPYVYDQARKKNIKQTLTNNEEDDEVSYTQTESFTFNEKESNGSDDDTVTILNPSAWLALQQVDGNPLSAAALNRCFDDVFVKHKLFTTVTVKEMLFDGVEFATKSTNFVCSIVINQVRDKATSIKFVDVVTNKDDNTTEKLKFSFFNFKNNTNDGEYLISRGLKDLNTLGHILKWNNNDTLPTWDKNPNATNNEECSKVRGCDSTLYPPHIDVENTFEIFQTDICRSVKIEYVGTNTYKGVEGYQFQPNEKTLYASTGDPTTDCYCSKSTKNIEGEEECFLNGVIDMQPCLGVPVLLSFPHFLWSEYQNSSLNLKPDEEKHKIFLLVEPNTGIPLQGLKRIQMNIALRPMASFSNAKATNLPQVMLPMIWIEEGVSLPQKYVDELNDLYFKPVGILEGVKYGLIGVFSFGTLLSAGFLIYKLNVGK